MPIHLKLIYIYIAPISTDHRVCPVKPVLMIPDARHFQSFGLGAMIVKPRYKLLLLVGAWHFQGPGLGAIIIRT